jgi:glycerate kinase
LVLGAVKFRERAAQSDVVLTGEGSLDQTTAEGKLVAAVARTARDAGAMPIALVGALGEGADAAAQRIGLQAYRAITPEGAPRDQAMRMAADLLRAETERAMRMALTDGRG